MARPNRFEQEIAALHGERPVEVFEDDVAAYEARRSIRAGGPVYEVRTRGFRDRIVLWWRGAAPIERFARLWWLSICGGLGLAAGAVVVIGLAPPF